MSLIALSTALVTPFNSSSARSNGIGSHCTSVVTSSKSDSATLRLSYCRFYRSQSSQKPIFIGILIIFSKYRIIGPSFISHPRRKLGCLLVQWRPEVILYYFENVGIKKYLECLINKPFLLKVSV